MVLYNSCLAIVICAIAYVIGEWIANITKAWVPSVFASAVVFLVGYWTILPKKVCADSGMVGLAATVGMFLLVTHIGTIISLKQLLAQWKTVTVCLVGLSGMVLISWFVAPLLMDKTLMIAGLPPLTGGIVAATTMQAAATKKGLELAALFAIVMYCMQGFAGYPLTALCLQKYGKKELKRLRNGEVILTEEQKEANKAIGMTAIADDSDIKTLLPKIPDKWNTPVFMLAKLGFVAWIATLLGQITPVAGIVWCLILGVLATTIGFLETNLLNRANSYWIVMFSLMIFVFDGLKTATPTMLKKILVPMVVLIVVGVLGMALFSFIISKILRMSFYLAFANCLTALYGFPCDAIITESTCNALSDVPDERNYLMSLMFPSMIVGGFVTVTITSVVLAGIFVNLL